MIKKVYCEDCKYYEDLIYQENCKHPNAIYMTKGIRTWRSPNDGAGTIYVTQPSERNKNNNCKDFEKK